MQDGAKRCGGAHAGIREKRGERGREKRGTKEGRNEERDAEGEGERDEGRRRQTVWEGERGREVR